LRELLSLPENPKIFDAVNALAGTFDLRTKMEEALAKGSNLPPFEIVIGEKVLAVYVSGVINPVLNKPLGVAVLFHDITDAKSLERLRQDFTAMMVHELRAPLTSIKSTAQLMGSAGISAQALSKYLATIDASASSMLDLVSDLLDVSKVEAGKFDIVCDEGDLSEVILERTEAMRPQIEAEGLKLEVAVAPDLPRAWFDKVRVKQVMNNLLSNALKYTDQGKITVNVVPEKVNGEPIDILVSVADTGIGIESDQINNLFARFGQLEAGRTRAGLKSSGLGLYITKKIVEGSGGKIWVQSPGPGAGSTFYFTVALAQTAKKSKGQSNFVPVGGQDGRIRDFTSNKVGQA
jgi:signal transduction histidine kinase